VSGESQKTRDWLAVLGGCSERVSPVNSLISGKIQGIWSESGSLATLDTSLYKELRVEFPTKQNREIFAANREPSLSNRDRPRLSMHVRNR